MRSLIIGMILFLSACNQGTTNIPYTDPSVTAKIDALTQALAAATHGEAQKFSELQIVGVVRGQINAAGVAVDFGPCANMGIFQGLGGSDSGNPLHSQFEIYKQIANAQTGCPASITSYNETTGLHDRLPYAAWDDGVCGKNGGTMYVETDIPQNSMNLSALENILVMMSPDPTDNTVYASPGNSVPQPLQIQSSFNALGGQCFPDVETRMVIPMFKNDVHVTGIPDSLVPGSWTKVAP